jgi:hypothetical protein
MHHESHENRVAVSQYCGELLERGMYPWTAKRRKRRMVKGVQCDFPRLFETNEGFAAKEKLAGRWKGDYCPIRNHGGGVADNMLRLVRRGGNLGRILAVEPHVEMFHLHVAGCKPLMSDTSFRNKV